ncbi:MAG TPA: hypothetical protein PLV42_12235 [bacterium]|nr:hypothetical protein [bacterium]
MRGLCFLLPLLFGWSLLSAKMDYAVLKVCFEKDSAPFLISTKDKKLAEKEGFQQVKDSELWMRKMKVLMDYQPLFSFKSVSDSCIAVSRIPTGSHTISVDFKSAAYSTIIVPEAVTKKFKADLLFETVVKVQDGPTATVELRQDQDRITLYQTVDNQPVANCQKECRIPAETPVYFMTRSDDEKVECPVQFEVIVSNKRDKDLACYDAERITDRLKDFVKQNNIRCRINVEYAFFRVYGDGCLVTLEPDANGLRPKDPEIRLIPLEKQKLRYYLQIGENEKKPYQFSTAEKKGDVLIPKSDERIVLIEVHEQ